MPLYIRVSLLLIKSQMMFLCSVGAFSSAFLSNSAHPYSMSQARISQVFTSGNSKFVEPDEVRTDGKSSSMMTLDFEGKSSIMSIPVSFVEGKSMHDFFALPNSPPLILRGSKNNQVNELENVDAELFERYKNSCAMLNVSLPTAGDRIYEVSTSAVKFPGLSVMSLVTIGVKIIAGADFPNYEMVLIRDSAYAKGNRLFVWFFNKIIGKDKDNTDGSSTVTRDQTTFSLSRFGVVPKGNGMISFEANANLIVRVRFPSFLMKAIPGASKEKFERTGSASLQKALEDDLPAALEGFRQGYVWWLEN